MVTKSDIIELVSKKYQDNLWSSSTALNYLVETRRIKEDKIKAHQLGYAKNNIGYKVAKEEGCLKEAIQYGIINGGKKRDFFEGYITFPVFNEDEYFSIYGRALGTMSPPHSLLPNSKKYIYNSKALKNSGLFIVESPIDALSLEQEGIYACALFGTGISKDIVPDFKGKVCYILFDKDHAGKVGTKKVAKALWNTAERIYCLSIPGKNKRHTDVNEYCAKVAHAGDRIKLLAKKTAPLLESPILEKALPLQICDWSDRDVQRLEKISVLKIIRHMYRGNKHNMIDKGSEVWVRCPNHAQGREQKPSVWVGGKGNNIFTCFACQVTGGPIQMVSFLKNINHTQAIDWLKNNFLE